MKSVVNIQGIDPEVVELCDAINSLEGITTYESCSGHGRKRMSIFFAPNDKEDLCNLLWWFSACHNGVSTWRCTVSTGCGAWVPHYCLESPSRGGKAYDQAKKIAAAMRGEKK